MDIVATKFADSNACADHYKKHQADFKVASKEEYERLAAAFCNAPADAAIIECTRASNSDRIRYNILTDAFAVVRRDGIIRTFFVAKVNVHGLQRNLDYFYRECLK